MARRPIATASNRAYAADNIPAAATTILQAHLPALHMLQAIVAGDTKTDPVAAIAALRSARTSIELIERNLVALAVLTGTPMGTVAATLGCAPSTLTAQLTGTDACLLGVELVRGPDGTWSRA